jgi:hypothetical protein
MAALREEFDHLEFNVDNFFHDAIPPADFTDELDHLDLRLKVLIALKGDVPKRDREIGLQMRHKLANLRALHDGYLRSAKAELDS